MKDNLFEINSEKILDNRGYFLNIFRQEENTFKQFWGKRNIKQINLTETLKKGTIRGLHFQKEPYCDAKIIRCLEGKVWDVAVDLRKESPNYKKWQAIELDSNKSNAIFIPEGFAHGFQVLAPRSKLLYIHSSPWIKSHDCGIRWDDKILKINWPLEISTMSSRDKELPYLTNDD